MAVKFNGESFPLKYKFACEFADGSKIVQTAEDISSINPEKSQFFDVLEGGKIKTFSLLGEGHTYLVDLTDGHFEIDGVSFYTHEEKHLNDFRIIFFRRHFHRNNGDGFTGHDVEYHLGWQTNDQTGKNIQRTININ